MNEYNPLIKIQFDGEALGSGRIAVSHLLRFLKNFTKVLHLTGRVMAGEENKIHRGPQPINIKDEVALDLVLLTHGSPSAVLGFERRQIQTQIDDCDIGLKIIENAIAGLSDIQRPNDNLPVGYNSNVIGAWRDAGVLFSQGVDKIEITLNHGNTPLVAKFTQNGFKHIQERIKEPQTNIRTIEGRLLMADFKEHGARCRVHPSIGDPVLCLFDNEQKDEVYEDILKYVRIVGEAKEDPTSGKITSIIIHDIERLDDKENEATHLLPQGTPISHSFWESPTLEELAKAQNVQPIVDVRALFGTWPGKVDDGFEESIDELRHPSMAGGGI